MEVVDNKAREDIGKLWYRIGILETTVWGENKTGGLRLVVNGNSAKLQELSEGIQHYMDADREATCLGLKEFEKRDAFKAELDQEVGEVRTAEINSKSQVTVAKIQAVVGTIAQVLTLAGIILVALK